MATAGDQINRALRLLGVLAEGETPSASTSQDALVALNQMIDSWSTERLSVFATLSQAVVWPANQASRTLGPSGNLPGTNVRPVLVDAATYYLDPEGISHTPQIINRAQYDSIPVKTIATDYPEVLFVNMTHPNIELTVYPVPTTALTWYFISTAELSQPALLSTELSFPPGYLRAFTYNLAVEIAPEFGVEPSPTVSRIAVTSKRDLKRINNPNDVMSMPNTLVANNYGYNIYTDGY